ncbi:MAG: SIR2 family protein [Candidatus Melainabacteria bacterium]|nr:SIR2 family protein [Candidatus Melainabacteria bacterium]
MDLDTAINRMTVLHRRGTLVPFIGAGMSVPSCTLWDEFIDKLEKKAGIKTPTSKNIIRRAEIAVSKLLSGGEDDFYAACRTALRSADPSKTPPQMKALCKIEWPFVISTNYDDWYPKLAEVKPEILGRSDRDCRQILSALNLPSNPILWCIQGYLGRIAEPKELFVPTSREISLFQQVVVGHGQYQEVISQSPLFRRTFAEVYRSKSFLFMGSGLEEDYLINLFSEIINNYRTSKLPHFALLKKGIKESGRSRFLTERLNIHVIEYDEHDPDLPRILNKIAERLEPHPMWFSPGATLVFRHRIALQKDNFFELRFGSLFQPNPSNKKIGYAFNSYIEKKTQALKPGKHGKNLLAELGHDLKKIKFEAIDKTGILWKVAGVKETIFTINVRNEKGPRDLRAIRRAVKLVFNEMDKYEIGEIRCGLIGQSLKNTHWDSTFSLIQLIQGYKDFVNQRKGDGDTPDLMVCSGDFRLFSNIIAGKINIDEVLACNDIRFWAIVHPALGREREVILLENEDTTLGDIMENLGLDKEDAEHWFVETLPKPSVTSTLDLVKEHLSSSLSAFGVLPGSRLMFSHRSILEKTQSEPLLAIKR